MSLAKYKSLLCAISSKVETYRLEAEVDEVEEVEEVETYRLEACNFASKRMINYLLGKFQKF